MRSRPPGFPFFPSPHLRLSILGAFFVALVCAACGGPELTPLPPPPGLEQMDSAVREQYGQLRAAADAALETGGAAKANRQGLGQAMGELGMWFHAYGLDESASLAYANARQLQPDNPKWAYFQAMLLAKDGSSEAALEAFSSSILAASSDLEQKPIQVRAAEMELLLGRTEEAIARLESLMSTDSSEETRLSVALADAHRAAGNLEPAIKLYQQTLETRQELPGVRYSLGLALRQAGRDEEAALFIAQADGSAKPDVLQMHDPWATELAALDIGYRGQLRQARRFAAAGHHRRALRAFRSAAELDPTSPDARLGAARMHLELGQISEAHELVNELSTDFPDSALAQSLAGRVAVQEGDPERAEALFRQALENDPSLLPTWLHLISHLRSQDDLEEAAEALEQARQLSPTDSDIICALAEVWVELGQSEKARDLLERTLPAADAPWAQRLLLEKLRPSSDSR